MSAMTNDPFKLARMAGYYKGVQSAGAAVSFGMDAVKVSGFSIRLQWFNIPPPPSSPSLHIPICATRYLCSNDSVIPRCRDAVPC